MKSNLKKILAILMMGLGACGVHAQGTAFTYQGRLNANGAAANGNYDFVFTLWNATSGGSEIGSMVTNTAVGVTNGLFTVPIDFGPSVFTGQACWLQINVESNGVGPYVGLAPRQQLTPTPYSIYAENSGSVNNASISAPQLNTVGTPVSGQVLEFNGGGLAWANPPSGWSLTGNAGTIPGTDFLGTTDNEPLELWVNGAPAFRLEPGGNVIGGIGNSVDPSVSGSSTIAGGSGNTISANSGNGPTIGGGTQNTVSNLYPTVSGGEYNKATANGAVVGGGYLNTASGSESTVGGGAQNLASGAGAFVGGGGYDGTTVGGNFAVNPATTVSGGLQNAASASYATVGGGSLNTANGLSSTIPGGHFNTASGSYSFAAGNHAEAQNDGSFVWADDSGGFFPSTANNQFSVRAYGGVRFLTGGAGVTIDGVPVGTGGGGSGGSSNAWLLTGNVGANPTNGYFLGTIDNNPVELHVDGFRAMRLEPGSGSPNVIGGASGNTVVSGIIGATISGGVNNTDGGNYATVGGGAGNSASVGWATVGGGSANSAAGTGATVPGGLNNSATGSGSFAAGSSAQAVNDDSFVWGDGSQTFSSSGADQFDVLATGGTYLYTASGTPTLSVIQENSYGGFVGVDTSTPRQPLDVNGGFVEVQGAGAQAALGGLGNTAVVVGSFNPTTTAVSLVNLNTFAPMHLNCSSITIQGGSDLAEPFQISTTDEDIPQGAVVVIDEENPGHLKLSNQPYDSRVAGVVSGANGINPGIQMHQQGLLEGGKNVALTGRVYVQADVSNGAIRPGDLLTTSTIAGRAMKVSDHAKAQGAILGKAMTGLKDGQGMVLVLVTLQ